MPQIIMDGRLFPRGASGTRAGRFLTVGETRRAGEETSEVAHDSTEIAEARATLKLE